MVDPDKDVSASLIGHGRTYSVGAVAGRAVFSTEEAISCTQRNGAEPCILIVKDLKRNEESDFIAGVSAASGSKLIICSITQRKRNVNVSALMS
jgi:hypothetical protein